MWKYIVLLLQCLIVFVVLSALALLAYLNSFEGDFKNPLARADAELRQIQHALGSYFIDNNAYPASNCEDGFSLHRLTTPVAYLSSVPRDPFRRGDVGHYYQYGSDGHSYYILTSWGPDQQDGIGGVMELDECEYTGARFTDFDKAAMRGGTFRLIEYMYDLSNGVTSGGDIIRIGP